MPEKSEINSTNNAPKRSFKENMLWFTSIVGFVFLVIGIIEFRVNQKINSQKFLLELSSKVRPALIFNSNGSIEADMGANNLIKELKVTKTPNKYKEFGNLHIVITPKKHLPYPPLLESIDNFEFDQKSFRGKSNEWIYELRLVVIPDTKVLPLFRLEIIKTH